MTDKRRTWPILLLSIVAVMLLTTIPWQEFGIALKIHPPEVRRALVLLLAMGYVFRRHFAETLWFELKADVARVCRWSLVLFGLLALVSVVLQTYAFRFQLFDVGIFHQVISSLVRDGTFFTSISGSGNHLLDHFSPSFILLGPFFWLTGGAPWTLPVAHVFLIGIGLAAWIYLAACMEVSNRRMIPLVAGVSLWCCFFGSLWANLWWGFHETAIAFAAWSWFLVVRLTSKGSWHRDLLLLVILAIGACSKETALIEGSGLAAVCAALDVRDGRRWQSFLWIIVSLALVGGLIWFELLPKPADKNYFVRYYGYLGSNVKEAVLHLLENPLKPIREIGLPAIGTFFWDLLLPWLGLPVLVFFMPSLRMRKLGIWLLAFVPSIGLLMLSTTPALRNTSFHYVLSLWPVMAALTICVQAEIKSERLLWTWVVVAALVQGKDVWTNSKLAIADLAHYGSDGRAFEHLPPGTKISASDRAGPWIANERLVTRWPDFYFFDGKCPELVLVHKEDLQGALGHDCVRQAKSVRREDFGPWTRIWLTEQ